MPPPSRARRHPRHPEALDPILTRKKGATSHPGRIVFGVGGVLFAAYIFNVGGTATFLDHFFRSLEKSAHLHDAQVTHAFLVALPFLGLAALSVVALIVFTAVRRGTRTLATVRRLHRRPEHTTQSFATLAASHGISQRVSREAFTLLLPLYRNRMRALFTDSLSRDLRLTPLQISDLRGNLMRMSDRQHPVQEQTTQVETVLELMLAVEKCKIRSLTESGVRRRMNPGLTAIPREPTRPRQHSLIRPARLPKIVPPGDDALPETGTD